MSLGNLDNDEFFFECRHHQIREEKERFFYSKTFSSIERISVGIKTLRD